LLVRAAPGFAPISHAPCACFILCWLQPSSQLLPRQEKGPQPSGQPIPPSPAQALSHSSQPLTSRQAQCEQEPQPLGGA